MTAAIQLVAALDGLVERGASLQVLPVCDEELQLDLELFRAFAERHEGLFHYVDHKSGPAPGELAASRAKLLETFANDNGLACSITSDGAHVHAETAGRTQES